MNSPPWRRPAIVTGFLLLIPLVMTLLDRDKPYGEGWHWGPASFLVMGALLFVAGLLYEVLAGRMHKAAHRTTLGGAILLAVLAIWSELAVEAVSKGLRMLLG